MKKYLTIKAVIEIEDDDNTINSFNDCLDDYDSIGRPIERLKKEGWNVEFVSLTNETDNHNDYNIKQNDETIENIKYLRVCAGVRYWEDGYINGVEDDACEPKMPFANIDLGEWAINIDTETGIIKDWHQGVNARVHYKTCDDNMFLLHISPNGKIENWSFSQKNIDEIKNNAF